MSTIDLQLLSLNIKRKCTLAQKQIGKFTPELEKKIASIILFQNNIDERVKLFQEKKIAILPSKVELDKEVYSLVVRYREFKRIYEKSLYLGKKISNALLLAERVNLPDLQELTEKKRIFNQLIYKYIQLFQDSKWIISLLTFTDIAENCGRPISWRDQICNYASVKGALSIGVVNPETTILFLRFLRSKQSCL